MERQWTVAGEQPSLMCTYCARSDIILVMPYIYMSLVHQDLSYLTLINEAAPTALDSELINRVPYIDRPNIIRHPRVQ